MIAVVALVSGTFCGMLGTVKTLEAVDKVNHKIPKEQQLNPWGWNLAKYPRLHREYKRLDPDARVLLHTAPETATPRQDRLG
jgi:hypothetical protein